MATRLAANKRAVDQRVAVVVPVRTELTQGLRDPEEWNHPPATRIGFEKTEWQCISECLWGQCAFSSFLRYPLGRLR